MRGIYFSANNDMEGFRLPINPSEVNVKINGEGEMFKIAKLGTVNIPKDVDLKEFDLESYFPAQPTHHLETEFIEPSFYIEKIEKWMIDKIPVRYIYVNGSFTINELVTIENFVYDESYGTSDVNYSLALKKYVSFSPKRMVIEKPKAGTVSAAAAPTAIKKEAPSRQNQKTTPQTYTLIRGDSLWKVAKKFTGNGNKYPELQQLNGIKDGQLRKLPVGLKLRIPPTWIKK